MTLQEDRAAAAVQLRNFMHLSDPDFPIDTQGFELVEQLAKLGAVTVLFDPLPQPNGGWIVTCAWPGGQAQSGREVTLWHAARRCAFWVVVSFGLEKS